MIAAKELKKNIIHSNRKENIFCFSNILQNTIVLPVLPPKLCDSVEELLIQPVWLTKTEF